MVFFSQFFAENVDHEGKAADILYVSYCQHIS